LLQQALRLPTIARVGCILGAHWLFHDNTSLSRQFPSRLQHS